MATKEELLERYREYEAVDKRHEGCACPFKEECELWGHCYPCVAWHRDHGQKPLPYCLRVLEEVSWRERGE